MENNQERVFEHYLELPEKARMAVIDEMTPQERCRFTRCSQLSGKEARASKNYIYGVSIRRCAFKSVEVTVTFGKIEIRTGRRCGFVLIFSERSGKQYLRYASSSRPGWQKELDGKTNFMQCAVEELRRWVKTYQKTIRKLRLDGASFDYRGETLKYVDLEFESLDNLEVLELFGDIEVSQIIPKLRRPLKELHIKEVENREYLLENFELVRQVQKKLLWWDVNLNNEQFLQLKANAVSIPIGELTEKDVFRFIRSWQNGTVGKVVMDFYWLLEGSNFNERRFLKLLRVAEREPRFVEIKHFTHPGRTGVLYFYRHLDSPSIRFITKMNGDGFLFQFN